MARLEVIQIRCDRCKRVELLPPQPKKERADLEVRLLDKTIKYDDLCTYCKKALDNIWTDIKEWDRHLNQDFGPRVPENSAAPLTPAPTLTPPKPHSLAAASKK